VVIAQGDIFWAELPEPSGLGSGFRRPVVVVQSDAINRSRISDHHLRAADEQACLG